MKYLGFLSFLSDSDVKCGLVLMKWCPYVEASVKGKEMEENIYFRNHYGVYCG